MGLVCRLRNWLPAAQGVSKLHLELYSVKGKNGDIIRIWGWIFKKKQQPEQRGGQLFKTVKLPAGAAAALREIASIRLNFYTVYLCKKRKTTWWTGSSRSSVIPVIKADAISDTVAHLVRNQRRKQFSHESCFIKRNEPIQISATWDLVWINALFLLKTEKVVWDKLNMDVHMDLTQLENVHITESRFNYLVIVLLL